MAVSTSDLPQEVYNVSVIVAQSVRVPQEGWGAKRGRFWEFAKQT